MCIASSTIARSALSSFRAVGRDGASRRLGRRYGGTNKSDMCLRTSLLTLGSTLRGYELAEPILLLSEFTDHKTCILFAAEWAQLTSASFNFRNIFLSPPPNDSRKLPESYFQYFHAMGAKWFQEALKQFLLMFLHLGHHLIPGGPEPYHFENFCALATKLPQEAPKQFVLSIFAALVTKWLQEAPKHLILRCLRLTTK